MIVPTNSTTIRVSKSTLTDPNNPLKLINVKWGGNGAIYPAVLYAEGPDDFYYQIVGAIFRKPRRSAPQPPPVA